MTTRATTKTTAYHANSSPATTQRTMHSTDPTTPSYWSDTIHCLQHAIHRLSDGHTPADSNQVEALWKPPQNSTTATTALKDIVHTYAPVGLESQFEQLYGLLHPCLVSSEDSNNAAAFLLGPRDVIDTNSTNSTFEVDDPS